VGRGEDGIDGRAEECIRRSMVFRPVKVTSWLLSNKPTSRLSRIDDRSRV
jgi:hypothetical protein